MRFTNVLWARPGVTGEIVGLGCRTVGGKGRELGEVGGARWGVWGEWEARVRDVRLSGV